MIGLMSLQEQADVDFARARRRAFLGWLIGHFSGKRYGPRSFEEVRRKTRLSGGERSRRVVEVSKIAGSVGRHREFDRGFMPTRADAERWKRVDLAFLRGEETPPVSLYGVGGYYYVLDGNHRVSVARYQGVEMIEAEVVRLLAKCPADSGAKGPACRTG